LADWTDQAANWDTYREIDPSSKIRLRFNRKEAQAAAESGFGEEYLSSSSAP